jgi:hypothetical protein
LTFDFAQVRQFLAFGLGNIEDEHRSEANEARLGDANKTKALPLSRRSSSWSSLVQLLGSIFSSTILTR